MAAGEPVIVVSIMLMVVAVPVLGTASPWPPGLVYGLNARLDEVYNWIVAEPGLELDLRLRPEPDLELPATGS